MLSELQTELLRKDSRVTQKDLIDKAIKFAKINKRKFIDYLGGKGKNNTKEMTAKFLALPKIKASKNWTEEIDTIEHDDLLRRNKKHDKQGYF